MKKRDRRELERYVRWVANEMELRDWTITLLYAAPDTTDMGAPLGTIEPLYGRKKADLRVCHDFRERGAEEQRHIIVHELTHLHIEAMKEIVRTDLEEVLGKPADTVLWNGFKRQMEFGVDGLAKAIAKHMPLIDWPRP